MQRFSPKNEGSKTYTGLPSPVVLQQEDESPEHVAFSASGACVQDSQRAVGNRDLS